MTDDMATALQQLVDKDSIRELMYDYTYCIDTNRPEDFLELFTEDCVFDPGPANGGAVRGRADVAKIRRGSSLVSSSHHNANISIRFEDSDRARSRTTFHAWHRVKNGAQPLVWGYYDDIVVRTDGGWRFAERVIRVYGDQGFGVEWNPGERLVQQPVAT